MITLIVVLILCGVALYVVNRVIPMDDKAKVVVNALAIVVMFLYALKVLGIFTFPHLRN